MNFDIIIIGSGPGGYVAAIRASQLGMNVAVVEKAEIGGICLNFGCIPTKSLLKSAQVYNYTKQAKRYGITVSESIPDFKKIIKRSRQIAGQMSKGVEFLFKKNNITVINGFASLKNSDTINVKQKDGSETEYKAKHIIIATGARTRQLPNLPIDGEKIIGYKTALTLTNQPESMLVVGSGAIGTELAYFYSSIGTKVTLVEFMPNVVPLEDKEVSEQLFKNLKKAKIKLMLSSTVESVEINEENNKCKVEIKTPSGQEFHETDIVLSAVGISPNIENIGLEKIGINIEKNRIKVDEFYRTNIKGIYAIGDIIDTPALAHVASAEGITCVENICNKNPETIDYQNIPSAVYTNPEIASVGYTEEKAREKGFEIKIGNFPFSALGKATAAGAREGFAKLIFNSKDDTLLGAHLIGMNVTEMLAELVVLKKLGATGHQIIKTIHPHPTMSEAIMEAAAAAYDEAIHL